MKIRLFLLLLALSIGSLSAKDKRPNILIILSDDMGFSDLGCYGSEIHTPNLDKLAKEGIRFTQFYNNARCCPTRASVMTGLYPHEAGIGNMTEDQGENGYRGQISRECVTIPEVLSTVGYRTYMCGKWHVCRDIRPNGDKSDWPIQRGFEKFYGTITGAGSYYDPTTLCRQNTYVTPENDPEYHPTNFYYTDAITDNAVRFLHEHSKESPDKPFFMYVAYTAAHWPMQAPESEIAKYKGKYDMGYEPIRRARFEKIRQLGLVEKNVDLSPQAEDWNTVTDKAWEARCMETYAAMVDRMDQDIGRLLAQLRQQKALDNTLILFLEDNGGCAEPMGRTDMSGKPPATLHAYGPDDLQPKIWPPMQTRDGRWVRTGEGVMPGPADTYIAYGRGWANVSDTPFREYKRWVHEGGISTPLIAHWPKGIPKSRDNKLETQPGHVVDLMSTCVDLAKATYPTERGGETIKPMEGISLVPALKGQPLDRKNPFFWEHIGNKALRDGHWKLVAKVGDPWELYDMDVDRSEMHDLAKAQPEVLHRMIQEWQAFAARADVLPLGTWRKPAVKHPPAKTMQKTN